MRNSCTEITGDVHEYLESPLYSPGGTHVCYEKSGRSYILPDTGGSPDVLPPNPAHEPHWYLEGTTNYITYCTSVSKTYNPPGETLRQELTAGYIATGSPVVLWANRGMDSGLTADGRWLGESYGNSFCVDLLANPSPVEYDKFYKADGSLEGQTCNGSMCPDDTGRYMSLLIPHEHFRIWQYNPSLDRWEESRTIDIPTEKGAGEVQHPEWSTHPEFATFTAGSSARTDYEVYILNTADGSYLKVLSGGPDEWGGPCAYPHLWVDSSSVNTQPYAYLTADRPSGGPPLAVSFITVSSDLDGDTLTHEWNWDYSGAFSADEDTGTTKTNSHVYDTEGTYLAAVRVSDGLTAPVIAQVSITVSIPDDDSGKCGAAAGAGALLGLVVLLVRRRRG